MAPRWTAAEDRLLRTLYAQGVPLRAISQRIGRSEHAVAERRRTLRIDARARSRPWTSREDQLVRAGAAVGLPATVLATRLRRTPDQVRRRRHALVGAVAPAGVVYSPAEDEAIRAAWTRSEPVDELARRLGRSPGAVRLRARALGLHAPPRRPRWTADEDAAVRDGYERGLTCAEIAATLRGRTTPAVAARAAKLGLATYARRWTAEEDHRLRWLVRDGWELERAAQRLGRTPEALRARTRKLGLPPLRSGAPPGGRGRPWTTHEDELLRLHAGLNPAALAELLGRSSEAVTQRLRRLGLRTGSERSPHHRMPNGNGLTPGQRATVARELRGGGPRRQLAVAQRLGVSPAVVRRVVASRTVRT